MTLIKISCPQCKRHGYIEFDFMETEEKHVCWFCAGKGVVPFRLWIWYRYYEWWFNVILWSEKNKLRRGK